MERQFGEFDLESVENLRGNVAVFREKADLFGELVDFIDHLQAFAPGRLLRVIDLAQVKDRALRRVTDAQTAILNDAPIAMRFAIFLAGVIAQKHVVGRQCTTQKERPGRGQVSTCGIWKWRPLPLNDLRQAQGEKN